MVCTHSPRPPRRPGQAYRLNNRWHTARGFTRGTSPTFSLLPGHRPLKAEIAGSNTARSTLIPPFTRQLWMDKRSLSWLHIELVNQKKITAQAWRMKPMTMQSRLTRASVPLRFCAFLQFS